MMPCFDWVGVHWDNFSVWKCVICLFHRRSRNHLIHMNSWDRMLLKAPRNNIHWFKYKILVKLSHLLQVLFILSLSNVGVYLVVSIWMTMQIMILLTTECLIHKSFGLKWIQTYSLATKVNLMALILLIYGVQALHIPVGDDLVYLLINAEVP